jgi:Ca2+-binding EF-hand superfamily protein
MKQIITFLSGLALSTAAAVAISGEDAQAKFVELDADSNGLISKEEAQADSDLANRFDELDLDGNGYVSYSELSAGHDE